MLYLPLCESVVYQDLTQSEVLIALDLYHHILAVQSRSTVNVHPFTGAPWTSEGSALSHDIRGGTGGGKGRGGEHAHVMETLSWKGNNHILQK